jgi:hypothetical protein
VVRLAKNSVVLRTAAKKVNGYNLISEADIELSKVLLLLSEIAGIRGLWLPVERDLWFQPCSIVSIDDVLRRERTPAAAGGKGARDER